MRHTSRIALLFGLVFSIFLGPTAMLVGAAQTSDIQVITTQNGQSVYDACYVLVGYSNVGCDENGDGAVTFQDIPYGTYTLRQTANLGAGRSVADTTINVTGAMSNGWESFYTQVVTSGGGSTSPQTGAVDIAIFTTENGVPAYDACYELVGYSQIGCDENRDGKVTFAAIPFGTYTVRQTANLGAGRYVNDFTIQVRGNINSAGFESFSTTIMKTNTGGSSAPSGSADIALITRDPQDGHLLTGTCYVLVGYSNEGCDENGDGQVTFADIPFGRYTVRQTRTPAGYPAINDYDINVAPMQVDGGGESPGVPHGFIVKQATEQNAPNTRNVSVVLVDLDTLDRLVSGACVEFVGASNVGCDEGLIDGQIDFVDVPAGGPYELRFTNVRAGYEVVDIYGPLSYTITAGPGDLSNRTIFVWMSGSGAGSSGASAALTNELVPMQISAMACTTADPDAIQAGRNAADGTCYWDVGAKFTVTTETGDYLGSCTLAGDRDREIRIVGNVNCSVLVPIGIPVVVTEDVSTVTPGTAPKENPLYYTWPTDRTAIASYMGVGFLNVPTGN